MSYDAIVIGAGSGGLTVAIGLAGFGRRVALIEATTIGGDCTNTGCIPSKRLLHLAAEHTGAPGGGATLSDVRALRDAVALHDATLITQTDGIDLIHGRARLTSRSTVTVASDGAETTLTGRHIVIATGARPHLIDIPGLPDARRLTNENLFELTELPHHLAIVGAGAVGLEMATAFLGLGVRVTLIDGAPRVLPDAMPDATAVIERSLRAAGACIHLGAHVSRYDEAAKCLMLDLDGRHHAVEGVDQILIAIGRRPNVTSLNLDAAGVQASDQGIAVNSWGRTNVARIWAVGDATVGSHQTHAANALGRRIVQRIALPWLPPIGRPPTIPSAVFCAPEIAWVGDSSQQIARKHSPQILREVRVAFADVDRGRTDSVDDGFVAITARRLTGRIISATIVGPHASELIAILTLALDKGISLTSLARRSYAYPTFAGAIAAAADDYARSTLGNLRRELATYIAHRWRRGSAAR